MDGSIPALALSPRRAGAAQLLVTAHFVFRGRVGGAEHMLYNVLRGLDDTGVGLGVLCADPANLDPSFTNELERRQPGSLVACGGSGPRFVTEQWSCLRRDLRAEAVLFPNYFVPPVVPGRMGKVVTVMHDMQFRHYPENFSAKKRAWLAASQAFSMRRADRVVAISDYVREDLLRQYGDRYARKLVTVPNPISWDRFERYAGQGAAPPPMVQPYILSVAAAYAHKNLEVLVRAFALVAQRDKALNLVFCGQDYAGLRGVAGDRPQLGTLIEALGLQGRVHVTGYVDDEALGAWYRHATMFAFPSIFEGFGMPPVEALGFGLPTLITGRTALAETTLGLATVVDEAKRPAAWADKILEVARNPARYRPTAAQVAELRRHYAPARVGRLYAEACLD